MKKSFLLFLGFCLSIIASAQTATVEILNVEHNYKYNGENGLRIHYKVGVNGAKNHNINFSAYFYNKDGSKNYGNKDGYKATDGNTCAYQNDKANYENTSWNNNYMVLPYSALAHTSGKNEFQFQLQVRDGSNNYKLLAASEMKPFSVTYSGGSSATQQKQTSAVTNSRNADGEIKRKLVTAEDGFRYYECRKVGRGVGTDIEKAEDLNGNTLVPWQKQGWSIVYYTHTQTFGVFRLGYGDISYSREGKLLFDGSSYANTLLMKLDDGRYYFHVTDRKKGGAIFDGGGQAIFPFTKKVERYFVPKTNTFQERKKGKDNYVDTHIGLTDAYKLKSYPHVSVEDTKNTHTASTSQKKTTTSKPSSASNGNNAKKDVASSNANVKYTYSDKRKRHSAREFFTAGSFVACMDLKIYSEFASVPLIAIQVPNIEPSSPQYNKVAALTKRAEANPDINVNVKLVLSNGDIFICNKASVIVSNDFGAGGAGGIEALSADFRSFRDISGDTREHIKYFIQQLSKYDIKTFEYDGIEYDLSSGKTAGIMRDLIAELKKHVNSSALP